MKKLLCLLLCLAMLLTFAACGDKDSKKSNKEDEKKTETETVTEPSTEPEEAETTEPEQDAEVVPLDSFYMDYKEADWTDAYYLQAYPNGDGTAYVEYKTAQGRKMANMDTLVLLYLAAVYEDGAFDAIKGKEIYEEGEGCASMYITRGEESCTYSYYGAVIPQEYAEVFEAASDYFEALMADVEEYAAKPQMGEGVDEAHAEALMEILNNSGIQALETLAIMDVADDENFSYNSGLSSSTGVETCTACSALMMTVPYSMVVVTVAEGTDLNTVAANFAAGIDWGKWVCVQPSGATIAVKDNMVLCLLGNDEMYTGTVAAIESAGWTVVQTLRNSNL